MSAVFGVDYGALVARSERRAASTRARNAGVVREWGQWAARGAALPDQGAAARARLAKTFPGLMPPEPPTPEVARLADLAGWRAPCSTVISTEDLFGVDQHGVVEIYLSAGPRSSTNRCVNDDFSQCGLWKVTWDLDARTRLAVEQVKDSGSISGCASVGWVQPAVSPDGATVAVARHCFNAMGEATERSLRAFGRTGVRVLKSTPPYAQYPTWYDEDTVVYNTTRGSSPETWQSTMCSIQPNDSFASERRRAGPGAAKHINWGYEDPHAHASPIDRPGGGPRITSFGGLFGERIPQVSDIDGGDLERVAMPVEEPNNRSFRECHHPAWNTSGDRILCTRYQDPEAIYEPGSSSNGDDVYPILRLHQSCYASGEGWRTPEPMVDTLTRAEINETSRDFDDITVLNSFPDTDPAAAGGCRTYVWKFGEWCGSDRFVVAALFCVGEEGDLDQPGSILRSRIMLVDLYQSGPSAYIDLLSWIEHDEGADPGSWDGVFVTCGAVQ